MKVGSKKRIALYASVIAPSLVLVDPIAWSSRSAAPCSAEGRHFRK